MATKQKINLSPPSSTSISDNKGNLKAEWRLWFNKLYQRLGGDSAYSNVDLEDFINNIVGQVDDINKQVAILETQLTTVTADVDSIKLQINIINDNLLNLQTQITNNTNDILIINDSINTINNNIIDINTTLTSLQTQITTNTNAISTLNSSVIKTIASVGAGISIWLSKVGNTANFKSLVAGTNITLDNTTNANEIVINAAGGSSYTLPIASASVLGGLKIGSGLSIAGDGTVSTAGGSSPTVISGSNMSFAVGYDITHPNNSGCYVFAYSLSGAVPLTYSSDNIWIGKDVGQNCVNPSYNIFIGNRAGKSGAPNYCTILGHDAMVTGADNNIAIGLYALNNVTTQQNIAIGQYAMSYQRYSNCIGIGYGVTVNGNNQIQLGDSSQTVYCYGAVQDRSDARDKLDIQDSDHGLDFIMKLRARKWRWNHREKYRTPVLNADGEFYYKVEDNDGSKAGTRYHYGLVAQELQDILVKNNIDFGGFQDHNINKGEDVLSIGYNELISPLIKAIQEQQLMIIDLQNQIKNIKNNGV